MSKAIVIVKGLAFPVELAIGQRNESISDTICQDVSSLEFRESGSVAAFTMVIVLDTLVVL
jgi:hypothetical protein